MYLSVIAFAFFIGCLVYRGRHKDKPINPADGLYAPYKPHMSLLERWRDEERRMAAAEEIADDSDQEYAEDPFCDDAEDEIEPDDPAITFCDEDEPEDEADASCLFCEAAAAEDPEEDAFCEKELRRLYRVRYGLEMKKAKMLFVYRVNDKTLSDDARIAAREKMESTKAWRGLQFDLNYVNNEISGLSDYIKRGN